MSIPCEYGGVVLKAEGVSAALGGVQVLRDVNLEIKDLRRTGFTQGQVVGLLGPSGIGKTTLFRILAGLDAPDSGTVTVEEDCKPVQRGMVGVVAQNYPLFSHRTVRGNMLLAGKRAGLSGKTNGDRTGQMLSRFGLSEHGSKYPAQLSGGQRQRVSIAQQLMCSDHFLLMDEPFSGLDLIAEEQVCQLIREMSASDELKTFILVTHDIPAALSVSDTIWLLGRDRDPAGKIIPGARVQASFNLVERGIAWQQKGPDSPEFHSLLAEIRALFPRL